ncbi:MAG: PilN domain-containing protein [Phycisphaerales bacterium JB065]
MKPINLISEDRKIEYHKANCIMAWTGGLAAWTATIATACMIAAALSHIESDFESTRSALLLRTTAAQSSAAESKATIDRVNARLAITKAVRSYPDWSVLLPVVSAEIGEQIALEKIALEPVRSADAQTRATLTLSGVGISRAAVSEFVMRLEETGAFVRVETASAQRRPIRDHEFFAFELHCRVGSGWEGESP